MKQNNYDHNKSKTTIFFDFLRNLIILVVTGYITYLIWEWNWIVAVIAAIPIYVIVMNIIGFLTLPLYMLTPESKLIKKGFNSIENGNIDELESINDEFEEKYRKSIEVKLRQKPAHNTIYKK